MNKMSLWRTKKRTQEAGRLTQVCVWAPEPDEERIRQICNRVAEPTVRGQQLRRVLSEQLDRRRTIYAKWNAFEWQAEVDLPLLGPSWFSQNIGGRITGPDNTHIELEPNEATQLKKELSHACREVIKAWINKNHLLGRVKDNTGVVTGQDAPRDPKRPAEEAEFAANEAKIAKGVLQAAYASRRPSVVDDPSVVEYEGTWGFPSFCRVAHRKQGDRVQFALIHMEDGGTSPTNMFEVLATHMRQRVYPDVDAGKIDWYDVFPPGVYLWKELIVSAVSMQHSNGVYSKPSWHGLDPETPADWIPFIEKTIEEAKRLSDENALMNA